jgi:hypothetical protein
MRKDSAKVTFPKPTQWPQRADVRSVSQLGWFLPEGILLVEGETVKDYLGLEAGSPRRGP